MLFYLPRLFVYHVENIDKKEYVEIVKIQEFKIYKYIGAPAMWATIVSGITMLILNPILIDLLIKSTDKLINVLLLIHSGIDHKSVDIEDFVISSQNLGVVKFEDNTVIISNSLRSSIKSLKTAMVQKLDIIANAFNLRFESDADYPEWQYKPN